MATLISESDWDILLGRIRDGICTPFLGAGANQGILPSGRKIAATWAAAYEYPLQDNFDLARVSQFLAVGKDAVWPKEEIKRMFAREGPIDLEATLRASLNPLSVLAKLPLPVYMTTNYDHFMSEALRFEGKTPRLEICRWNELVRKKHKSVFEGKPAFIPTSANPVVFHLHGHLDMVESLVLTEDDYLDFMITFSRLDLLPPRIQESLTFSSLLFLGYRLADIDFRVIFRSLFRGVEDSLRRINIAIQLPPDEGPSAQAYLDRYFDNARVKVYWGDTIEFCAELQRRWIEGTI
jgi:hypothetical protein